MTSRVLKYTFPVDDEEHVLELNETWDCVLVDSLKPGQITMWFRVDDDYSYEDEVFKVFATGADVPTDYEGNNMGSCVDAMTEKTSKDVLIWHIFRQDN